MPMQKNWEGEATNQKLKDLPKPQRNAVIFLAAIAVFIVVVWVWQMNTHINGPFTYKGTATGTDTSTEDYNKVLKSADTDKDGLSDYDEIYTYKTSPYLEDTDSDGLSDKKEVDDGTNPLCPQGKDCSASIDTSSVGTASSSAVSSDVSTGTDALTDLNSANADETILKNALGGTSDAASLRQLLISSGASAEEINKISDEDLMKSYQETLESQSQSQSTPTN